MTPEEIRKAIEENRKRLQNTRGEQIFEREVRSLVELDEPEEAPADDELETHRYEAVNAAEVQEI